MIEPKDLPYKINALEPYISEKTLYFHHGKHYVGYVNKTNELLPEKMKNAPLVEIITYAKETQNQSLFNQAAQVWNHEFFFRGLRPTEKKEKISDALKLKLEQDFGSLDTFKKQGIQIALNQFGSGWVWLVLDKKKMKLISTPNAETPLLMKGMKPLWTLDVWEHAYYLDYKNVRINYATALINQVDWAFVEDNLYL